MAKSKPHKHSGKEHHKHHHHEKEKVVVKRKSGCFIALLILIVIIAILIWLMSHFNIQRLHYVGTDMLTRFIGGAVDEMNDETFAMYMKYHLCICERSDMIGATFHMLDIFRKE